MPPKPQAKGKGKTGAQDPPADAAQAPVSVDERVLQELQVLDLKDKLGR